MKDAAEKKQSQYEAQKKWNAKHPEKMREYARKHYWKNPEKRRKRQSELARQKQLATPDLVRQKRNGYHLTMMERRVGRKCPLNCELCGNVFTKKAHADHDHKSGIYRGWLCRNCNSALGLVSENIELLRKMILWIEKFK